MCENTLWVYWKDQKRQRHKIGELTFDETNGEFNFKYTLNSENLNVKKAIEEGFILFSEFPDLNKKYKSEKLFRTFKSRLPDFSRKDFPEIIAKYNVYNDENVEFELLKKTGGRLITDSIDLIQPILNLEKNYITRKFPIAGVEYYDVCDLGSNNECFVKYDDFNENTKFSLKPESKNKWDKCAVEIFIEDKKIGYIPRFYSKMVFRALKDNNYKVKLLFDEFYKSTNCPDCLWVTLIIEHC